VILHTKYTGARENDGPSVFAQAALEAVLARADKMGQKGDIIVPAIPALDFGRAADAPAPDASAWPAFMRAPLAMGRSVIKRRRTSIGRSVRATAACAKIYKVYGCRRH
jgi:hypothetical protein